MLSIYYQSIDLLHLKIESVITLPFGPKEAWNTDWRNHQFLPWVEAFEFMHQLFKLCQL